MRIKTLFLDIDFVLNSHLFEIKQAAQGIPYIPYEHDLDPDCLKRLKKILDQNEDLHIVISSSWRESVTVDRIRTLFSRFDIPADRIIGATEPFIDKALSIERWVKKNNLQHFLILDDDALFDRDHPLCKSFYRVSTSGLRDHDVVLINQHLKRLSGYV